ncbi:MAG: prolyl oligopeptidase family serine peptidase [Anaerolineae bacterium]
MKVINLTDDAPWKRRFRLPLMLHIGLARHNPARGIVVTNLTGVYQMYAWDVDTGTLRQLTDKPTGVQFGGITEDGRYIIYHDATQGNEIGHYVRVPFEGDVTTPRDDLTPDFPPYASNSLSESSDSTGLGYNVALGEGISIYHQAVAADGALGQPQLLYRSTAQTFGALLSSNGEYAVIATSERTGTPDLALMAFALKADAPVRVLQEYEGNLFPVAFSPVMGDTRLLALTSVTGDQRPVIWDVATGDRTDIPLQDLEGNIVAWGWSPDGKRLLLEYLHQAQQQCYVYDLERSLLHRLNHPAGTYHSAHWVDSDTIYAIWQSATHPPQVAALSAHSGELRRVVMPIHDVPESRPWRSVMFPSSGGVQVQAWLATPDGDGPFPTIVHAHGGPTDVQQEVFLPLAQAWLDHGFAFMSVNYRGSTTFGRAFEQAIWGIFGHREVDDLAAAHHWLVTNGIARADAIFLTGVSYGGYLTLQALGRRPELWAGGMAEMAIADWRLLYEDENERMRSVQRAYFGGTPQETPEQHRASSPITYAEAVSAPVLIIQGRSNTRTPARQIEVYEARMKALGKDITVHWYEAEQFAGDTERSIAHMELMLQFAYRVLG